MLDWCLGLAAGAGAPPAKAGGPAPPQSGTTDYRGSDPVGSDTRGSDPKGSDTRGSDPYGNGKG